MHRKWVHEEYRKAVRDSKFATPELKASLKTSDRVPGFIDRLSQEITKAEQILFRKGRVVKLETLQWAVQQMTETFLQGIEAQAKNNQTSQIARALQARQLDESLNPEKYLKEMGVMTDDPAQAKETR
jgi:hypothetical protein